MPYYDDPSQLTPYHRDQMIVELRKRGLTYRAIGKQVGMDGSAVYRALQRLQAGGPGTRPQPLTRRSKPVRGTGLL
jgi:IS30 family transposase